MQSRYVILIVLSLLLIMAQIPNIRAASIEIDKTSVVSTVIDGSSFTLNSGETVKLACINTPPLGQPGYNEAKYYLTNILQGKIAYLDVDDLTSSDQYSRLICVAYIDYNSTHYINVNMAMVANNYATMSSLNSSEFNPSSWSLFTPKDTPLTSTNPIITPTPTPTTTAPNSPSAIPSTSPDVPEFSVLIGILAISLVTALVILTKKKLVKGEAYVFSPPSSA
jgi:hypothetical protein